MFAARAAFMTKSAIGDPYWSSTYSLLHLDSNLTDSAGATWTASGAAISTSEKKFGAGSLYFASAGDYIYATSDATKFAFGTGDFTIEMWIYPSSVSGTRILYDSRPAGLQTTQPTLYMSGALVVYYANSGNRIVATSSVSVNTWNHIALCRSGSSTRLFLNGTQEGSTYTDTIDYTNTTDRPYMGRDGFGGVNGYQGYIDEVRVTKAARYTASFTAPTQAFLDS